MRLRLYTRDYARQIRRFFLLHEMRQHEFKKRIGDKSSGKTRQAVQRRQRERKQRKEEFLVISKVTGIGILIIGLLGFIIKFAWELIR